MSKYLELFTGSFDESIQEKTKLENRPYVAYSIKEKGIVYTIVPKKDEEGMYTIYRVVKKDISELTYNAIDLGLPSGTLWADRNIGATSPEECGSYFQWGNTENFTTVSKIEVSASELANIFNSLFNEGLSPDDENYFEINENNVHEIIDEFFVPIFGYNPGYDLSVVTIFEGINIDKFNWENYFDTNKEAGYRENGCPESFNKYSDSGLTQLESVDDAAHVHMGSEWRIPTKNNFEELINYTTKIFVDYQNNEYSLEDYKNLQIQIKGIKFIGTNGNSIFIPTNDVISETSNEEKIGIKLRGSLHTSNVVIGNSWMCSHFTFIEDSILLMPGSRLSEIPIRGIKKP